jgi:hypothetical protein
MKRFVLGAGWFLMIWISSHLVTGIIIGAVVGASGNVQLAVETARYVGHRYVLLYLLGSIAISAVGTIAGWLPGTDREMS